MMDIPKIIPWLWVMQYNYVRNFGCGQSWLAGQMKALFGTDTKTMCVLSDSHCEPATMYASASATSTRGYSSTN